MHALNGTPVDGPGWQNREVVFHFVFDRCWCHLLVSGLWEVRDQG